MTNEQIENFLVPNNHLSKTPIRISFKNRNNIVGVFIDSPEFKDLRAKNFWRVVQEKDLKRFLEKKEMKLVKIFNGAEFTKLVVD